MSLRIASRCAQLAWLALASGCAASSPSPEPTTGQEEIIGGVLAPSAKLDAVGSLVIEAQGTRSPFCTATLIAPEVVLTAKHCAIQLADPSVPGSVNTPFTQLGTVYFAVGADASAPKRQVKATDIVLANLDVGGIGYGSDVAAYRLEAPITDIEPLPVAAAPLAQADVGTAFVGIGYGVRDRAQSSGLRTMGNVTLSMLEGKAYEAAFGDVGAYLSHYGEALGRPLTPEEDAALRQRFETPLLSTYEAFFAAKEGDAQLCSGDSGGPLLRKVDGKLSVFGVASWVPSKVERDPCSRGVVYATFGTAARELVDGVLATACGDVPVAGRCEGAVAVRCVSMDEGTPRITRTRCDDVDQTCSMVDGKAACVDP